MKCCLFILFPVSGAASVPPLSLALFYKGKRLPNRAIRCAIYATSVVYHVNCRLSTVSKICIQLVYKKFTIWRSFPLPAWLSALSPAPRSCLAGTPPSPPAGVLAPQVQPVPLPAQARGSKGRSPLHKKTKNLPLPPGRALCERGRGDGGRGVYPSPSVKGAEKQTKGRVGRRPRGQAPPPGYYSGRDCQCRKRSDAGAPGAEPPAKLTYSLPLPRRGRGSGGWGQKQS